jgi:hypothetical protein
MDLQDLLGMAWTRRRMSGPDARTSSGGRRSLYQGRRRNLADILEAIDEVLARSLRLDEFHSDRNLEIWVPHHL